MEVGLGCASEKNSFIKVVTLLVSYLDLTKNTLQLFIGFPCLHNQEIFYNLQLKFLMEFFLNLHLQTADHK